MPLSGLRYAVVTDSDTSSPFDAAEGSALQWSVVAGSVVSILGSLFIVLSYVLFPRLRSFPNKLIALLSVADLVNSVTYLLPNANYATCQTQAALTQFFSMSTFCWTAVFAFNTAQVLVWQRADVEELEAYYHLFTWGISGAFLFINLGLHSFGTTYLWCWITADNDLLRLFTFYGPLVLIFVFNIIVCIVISHALKGHINKHAVQRRLLQYLAVFFFVRIWSVINRLQNWISPNDPVFFLYLMHALTSPLQGFCNAFVYGFNLQVRQHYFDLCCLGGVQLASEPFLPQIHRTPSLSADNRLPMPRSNSLEEPSP